MTKKLDETTLGNELKASAFFAVAKVADLPQSPPPPKPKPGKPAEPEVVQQAVHQSVGQSIDRSIDRPNVDHSAVMGKPRGFYITEQQNQDLDFAVLVISKRLAGKLPFKVDRSVLVRLLLELADLTDEENLDKLAQKLVTRSISQLTG